MVRRLAIYSSFPSTPSSTRRLDRGPLILEAHDGAALVDYWLIVKAKEMGFQRFDLLTVLAYPEAGTHAAGMRAFKAKWGGELV